MMMMMLILFINIIQKIGKKKILILMFLEVIMMWMFLISMKTMPNLMNMNISPLFIMIIIMVTESVLGLSILTSSSRNSSLISTMNMNWF